MIDVCFMSAAADAAELLDPSVVLVPLPGTPGEPVTLAPARSHYPASMIKVPIAAALALAYEDGRLTPRDVLRVDHRHVTANDAPSPFVAGYETTAAATAAAMLTASDNVATNVLIDALGRAWIGDACRARLGLAHTAVRRKLSGALPLIDDPESTGRNSHPAADAATLFAAIAGERDGRFGWIYDALAAQVWNDKIPAGLHAGDAFAHKTGDTDDASHDGGILTLADGRRFVFVVYTALRSSPASDASVAQFARIVRDALGSTDPASS